MAISLREDVLNNPAAHQGGMWEIDFSGLASARLVVSNDLKHDMEIARVACFVRVVDEMSRTRKGILDPHL